MGALESNTTLIYGIHIRESANDGSDFSNGAADYRVLFLGEDGQLHVKDSSGTVTDIGAGSGASTSAGFVTYQSEAGLSAERVVTTPSSGGVIPKCIVKASDESVQNNTLQDDNDLVMAIGASEKWLVEINIYFASTTAAADFKYNVTFPTSPTASYWSTTGLDSGGSANTDAPVSPASATGDTSAGSGVVRHARVIATLVNGSNAGNITLQWAQNSTNATDTTVKAGSSMIGYRLA